ncbi:MAG: hypothetical protein SFW66_10255 [Gammaproteobacteria bacterium]|nr:hypothetical protein [Gammaproteobacteria bacterium]
MKSRFDSDEEKNEDSRESSLIIAISTWIHYMAGDSSPYNARKKPARFMKETFEKFEDEINKALNEINELISINPSIKKEVTDLDLFKDIMVTANFPDQLKNEITSLVAQIVMSKLCYKEMDEHLYHLLMIDLHEKLIEMLTAHLHTDHANQKLSDYISQKYDEIIKFKENIIREYKCNEDLYLLETIHPYENMMLCDIELFTQRILHNTDNEKYLLQLLDLCEVMRKFRIVQQQILVMVSNDFGKDTPEHKLAVEHNQSSSHRIHKVFENIKIQLEKWESMNNENHPECAEHIDKILNFISPIKESSSDEIIKCAENKKPAKSHKKKMKNAVSAPYRKTLFSIPEDKQAIDPGGSVATHGTAKAVSKKNSA